MSNHNQNQSSDGEVVYTKIRGGLARVGKEGTAQDLNDFYNGNSNEFNEVSCSQFLIPILYNPGAGL